MRKNIKAKILLILNSLAAFRIGFRLIVVAWLAIEFRAQPQDVGIILLFSSTASILFAKKIGILVDSSKNKILLCKISEFLIFFSLILLSISLPIQNLFFKLFIFLLALFILILFEGIANISTLCLAKNFVFPEKKSSYVATNSFITQIFFIISTALAGSWIVYVENFQLFVPVIFVTLLRGIIFLFLPQPNNVIFTDVERHISKPVFLFFKNAHPQLIFAIFSSALVYSAGQLTNTLLPGLVTTIMRGNSKTYAAIEISWAAGALTAALLCRWRLWHALDFNHQKFPLDKILLFLLGGVIVIVPPLAKYAPFGCLLIMHLLLGAIFSYIRMRGQHTMLMLCPSNELGQYAASLSMITGVIGVVIFIMPTLLPELSIPSFYTLSGLLLFISAIIIWCETLPEKR